VEEDERKKAEDPDHYSWVSFPDYLEIARSLGNIVADGEAGDYQGDYYFLLEKDGKYGWLTIGYGSCSGCDALQACVEVSDFQELYDSISRSVQWKDSKEEAIDYLKTKNWRGDFSWYYSDFRDFLKSCANALGEYDWEPPIDPEYEDD